MTRILDRGSLDSFSLRFEDEELEDRFQVEEGQAGLAGYRIITGATVLLWIQAAFLIPLATDIPRTLAWILGGMMALVGVACFAASGWARTMNRQHALAAVLTTANGLVILLLATVGQDPQAGISRFTLGTLYLWQGLDLVAVLVGLFAIPEIVDLVVRGTSIAGDRPSGQLNRGVLEGVKDTFRHFWLTIRCSLIGTFIGITPGLGGAVAQWMAYGHATQSARNATEREGFGRGDVRGVLGPCAASNSKEGGSLIPTVAFGVPGSTAMAILLGGFFVLGLVPGPDMLTTYLPVTFSMVWTIVLANLITVVVCFLFLNHLASLTSVRGHLLVPVILVMVFVGAYTANNHYGDLLVMLIFGGVGYLMVAAGWPRAPFVLGLVLGKIAENYLYISVARYQAAWLERPIVLVLIVLTVLVILYPFVQMLRERAKRGAHA